MKHWNDVRLNESIHPSIHFLQLNPFTVEAELEPAVNGRRQEHLGQFASPLHGYTEKRTTIASNSKPVGRMWHTKSFCVAHRSLKGIQFYAASESPRFDTQRDDLMTLTWVKASVKCIKNIKTKKYWTYFEAKCFLKKWIILFFKFLFSTFLKRLCCLAVTYLRHGMTP